MPFPAVFPWSQQLQVSNIFTRFSKLSVQASSFLFFSYFSYFLLLIGPVYWIWLQVGIMQNYHFCCCLADFFISVTNFTLKCSISYTKIVDCLVWNEALHNSGQSMCLVSCPKRPWLEVSYWINPELLRILLYTSCYCLSLLCLVPAFSISVIEECSITFSKDKPVVGRILRQLPRSCSPVYIL